MSVWAGWLSTLALYCRACVKQLLASEHYDESLWGIARLPSTDVIRRQSWPAIEISDCGWEFSCISQLDERIKSEHDRVTEVAGTSS